MGIPRVLLVALLTVAMPVLAGCRTDTPVLVDDSGAPIEGAGPGDDGTFSVGDRIALGDWQVLIHEAVDPYTGEGALGPEPGNRWVAIDVEVFNGGETARDLTPLLCFDLQDDQNRTYSEKLVTGSTVGWPSGEIPPGGARRGLIVYEVLAEAEGLRVNFSCDLFARGTATVAVD